MDQNAAVLDDTYDEPPIETSGRTLWGEPLTRLLLLSLSMLLVSSAILLPAIFRSKGMSVFDEATHADYAYQVAHGHIPGRGSILAKEIRAETVCRGPARAPNAPRPDCGVADPPLSLFGGHGEDYNFFHPPVYYTVTGVLARIAELPFSKNHFIAFARGIGVLWMFAAMLVMYLGLRRFRVRWYIAWPAALVLAGTASLLYAGATVTNDAAAALCGSAAVLVLGRILVDGKLGWIAPGVVTLLAAGTKELNALPMLAIGVLLLAMTVRGWRADPVRARQYAIVAASIFISFLIVYKGWDIFQAHRGVKNWVNPVQSISSRPIKGAPFNEVFSTSFQSANLMANGFLPVRLVSSAMTVATRFSGLISVAAVGAGLVLSRPWQARWAVPALTALGALTFPWIVQLQLIVSSGNERYFPNVVPRYGMSFIPFFVASMALAVDQYTRRDDKDAETDGVASRSWVVRCWWLYVAGCLGAALFSVT